MNTKLRKEAENEFEKEFFKLIILFLEKHWTLENVRNHRDIKLVTSDKRRKRLVSEPNYHSHKKKFKTFDGSGNETDKSKNDKAIISRYVNI